MAINNVKDTQSLLHDIEDWMDNPKFQPQEQNKWFFGEGLSYYTQLCEVVKVLTYLQENFKIVIANEKSLEQAYNEVKDLPNQVNALSTKVDDLTNTVSDLPTRVQELETKVTKLISDVSSQLTRIETLEGKDFLQQVAFNNSSTITFTDEGKSEGTQTFSATVIGSIPANLTPNLAYLNNNPNSNIVSNVVLTWDVNENKCYLKKDMSYYSNGNINTVTSRLELDSAWFTINENTLTLKASVLDNYLTKDDAPGYGDILTNANAKTTYVAKNEATGYNDILTKTLASTTYETIENASNYVTKGEAVGYDDILTKTEASGEYETITNASATYETKANASATYETKQHASNTYIDKSSLTDAIYPIGSIYMSVNDVEPSILFGGTWEKIKDKFLLASGNTHTTGSSGGEEQHTLTIAELPTHTHTLSYEYNAIQHDEQKHILQPNSYKATNMYNSMPSAVEPYGGNQAHNNMPPYIAVNIWKRVS